MEQAEGVPRSERLLAAVPVPLPVLGGLLAWRAQVAAVPERPLDPSTLRRYELFLAIPLASRVGGALVERVLDRALG